MVDKDTYVFLLVLLFLFFLVPEADTYTGRAVVSLVIDVVKIIVLALQVALCAMKS